MCGRDLSLISFCKRVSGASNSTVDAGLRCLISTSKHMLDVFRSVQPESFEAVEKGQQALRVK